MPASTPTITSLTRTEFTRLEQRGAAGTTTELAEDTVAKRWRDAHPGWRGRHWAFLDDGEHGVLRLHPINLTRATRQQATTAAA